jgi:dihydrofolate reductase
MTIILYIAESIDGFIADKNGEVKFLDKFNGVNCEYEEFYNNIDIIFMGNTTYQQVLTFGEFPYKNNDCYIFSKSINEDLEKIKFLNKVNKEEILKISKNKNAWLVGGAKIIKEFLELDLIDEIIITLMPLTLGEGVPLFLENKSKKNYKAKQVKEFDRGIVQIHYVKS